MAARFKKPIELTLSPIGSEGRCVAYSLLCNDTYDFGTGDTVQEAYDDLMQNLEELYNTYVMQNECLEETELKYKEWLMKNIVII